VILDRIIFANEFIYVIGRNYVGIVLLEIATAWKEAFEGDFVKAYVQRRRVDR
jgi:hypothetical protein